MDTRVVILAAGKGKRMGGDTPKPLVKIAGRPMIEHLLESVIESGIDTKPVIVVAPDTLDSFNHVCRDDRCEFAVQEEQLGTGNAVQSAQAQTVGAQSIMVLYGDHPFLSAAVLEKVAQLHEEHGAAISMLTATVPHFEDDHEGFKAWGRIIRDENRRFIAIREAKDASPEELEIKEVNPAIYMFDAEWLWEHLPEIKNKNASGEYYLTDLLAMAVEEGEDVVTASADPFEVIGINTPEELARAEKILG